MPQQKYSITSKVFFLLYSQNSISEGVAA